MINYDDLLAKANLIFENYENNPEIKSRMVEYGFTEERMNNDKKLLDDAIELVNKQKTEYAEKYQSTENFQKALDECNKTYLRNVKLARIALKDDPELWVALDIVGKRKLAYSSWVKQVEIFYNNALNNENIKSKLSTLNLTEEKLQAGKALLENVKDAKAIQMNEMSDAQKATKVRDKALEELNDWVINFLDIAEVALDDDPQLLEALGIVVH